MRWIDPCSVLVAAIAAATLALVPLSLAVAGTPADDISSSTVVPLPPYEDQPGPVEVSPGESLPPTAAPTDAATEPESPAPIASATPTEQPTTSAPTSPPRDPAPSASPSQSADAESGLSSPAGLPLIVGLGALVAAVGAGGRLLAGRSRKRRWDAALDVEREQAQWVTEELVPRFADEQAPVHELVGHWSAAQPTLDQLQTNLADLASQAPDDERAASVAAMSTASAEVRSAAASLLSLASATDADPEAVTWSRATLLSASAHLTSAISPPN